MDNENIKWLTTIPATDVNFKSHLQMTTDEEIKWSITRMSLEKGNKSRVAALRRELRRRARERNKK